VHRDFVPGAAREGFRGEVLQGSDPRQVRVTRSGIFGRDFHYFPGTRIGHGALGYFADHVTGLDGFV